MAGMGRSAERAATLAAGARSPGRVAAHKSEMNGFPVQFAVLSWADPCTNTLLEIRNNRRGPRRRRLAGGMFFAPYLSVAPVRKKAMIEAKTKNVELRLTLTEEERVQLLAWLERRMRDKLVEEHRTDSLEFKKLVARQERILDGLIAKLRR